MNDIYLKLSNIQNKLKAPKNQFNSFGKYNYRSCEDILEAVKPICVEEKTTLVISDIVECIGNRNYVKATVRLVDYEDSTKFIEATAYAREEETKKGMDGSQITGASSSYARKYALNGLFNIDDTKDSDGTNTHEKENKKQDSPKTQMPTLEQAQERMTKKGKKYCELTQENLQFIIDCDTASEQSKICAKLVLESNKIKENNFEDEKLPWD